MLLRTTTTRARSWMAKRGYHAFKWTNLEVETPGKFAKANGVYVPFANAVFSFQGDHIFRMHRDTLTWYEKDPVKGKPGRDNWRPVVCGNELLVMAKNGVEEANVAFWSIQLEAPEEEGEMGTFVATEEETPSRFQWYRTLPIPERDLVVVYGETYFDEVTDAGLRIEAFDLKKRSWLDSVITGELPVTRTNIGAWTSGNKIFMMAPSEDLVTYELYAGSKDDMRLSRTDMGCEDGAVPPIPTKGASFTCLNNKLVVFGGIQTGEFVNSFHVLDLDTLCWEDTSVTVGDPPSGRMDHAAVPISDTEMVVFGGKGDFIRTDMYRLELIEVDE